MAALDNGKYGLVFPSGFGATTAVLHLLKTGDHILSNSESYEGTRTLLRHFVKTLGIEIDYVDMSDGNLIKEAIKSNTRVRFFFISTV